MGSIAEKQSRQLEVAKELKATPNDPYLFGERAQLEFDIVKLENNSKYVNRIRPQVDAGELRVANRLTVPVPDIAVAVKFWTAGCGALLLDTRLVDGRNVTRVGFGPESLRKDDGAKFSLELVESAEVVGKPSQLGGEGSVVQYVQLGIPIFRLSRVMATGGEVVSAYGGISWGKSKALFLAAARAATHRLRGPPTCSVLLYGPERRAPAVWVPKRG